MSADQDNRYDRALAHGQSDGQEGQATDFLSIVSTQLADFLKIIPFMNGEGLELAVYSTRLMEYVNSQAKLAEVLLDSCGAKQNRAWYFLRELVATIGGLSKVLYQLRYLEVRILSFDILQRETREFQDATGRIREAFDRLLQRCFTRCDDEARKLGISVPSVGIQAADFPLFKSPGKLDADIQDEDAHKKDDAIIKIATAYLEISDEYTLLGFDRIFTSQELVEMVPEHVNEERLRTFEARVHNLQAVYDTYIQHTEMEARDARLLKLRGCISMALHLLEIATELVHFHERHELNSRQEAINKRLQDLLGINQLLDVMGNYALFYCTKFLQTGKLLSEEAVMDYAQITSKRIPIPIYRGFHVRPSTYISKIVRHYGADVSMRMGEEIYDAGCVFDLFRVNEEINMEKRRLVALKLSELQGIASIPVDTLAPFLKEQLDRLEEAHLLVIHQEILPEDLEIPIVGKEDLSSEDVRGAMNQVIARVLAVGKIDIIMMISVTFIGDRRPLEDIALLAQAGYGEDAYGNNIQLPAELSYLYK